MTITCTDILTWLRQPVLADQIAPPPADLVAHVSRCAVCRGVLAALVVDLLQTDPESLAMACTACQDDLAAFIDIERSQGSAAALASYPAVWWHLWTCATCAETYHLTNVLLDAEETGEMTELPLHAPRHPIYEPVYLSRSFLQQALVGQTILGETWGEADMLVLVDEERAGYRLCVSIQPDSIDTWTMMVTVTPAIAGAVIVQCGPATYHAVLSAAGEAVLASLPAAVLLNATGPDIVVTFE